MLTQQEISEWDGELDESVVWKALKSLTPAEQDILSRKINEDLKSVAQQIVEEIKKERG